MVLTETQRPRPATHRQTGPGAHAYQEAITLNTEPNDDGRGEELAAIGRDYPPWHAWQGPLGGLLYARRPMSSPPMVVRAVTPDALRTAIETAEAKRGLR